MIATNTTNATRHAEGSTVTHYQPRLHTAFHRVCLSNNWAEGTALSMQSDYSHTQLHTDSLPVLFSFLKGGQPDNSVQVAAIYTCVCVSHQLRMRIGCMFGLRLRRKTLRALLFGLVAWFLLQPLVRCGAHTDCEHFLINGQILWASSQHECKSFHAVHASANVTMIYSLYWLLLSQESYNYCESN